MNKTAGTTQAITQLFTLANKNGTRLQASNYGAAVVSLFTRDRYGQLADVVLGYENQESYFNDDYYIGTVVGRYANRIAGDSVTIENVPYKISATAGGYHLHGGNSGFNKKFFNASPFDKETSRGVVFTYHSPHLEEGFPGALLLEVMYTLDDNDRWSVEYKAVADRTTLVNFTQHSYFNLTGDATRTIDEHELKIDSDYFLPVNALQVPTGELAAVAGTPFDFTQFKKIGSSVDMADPQLQLSHGFDHSWVLEKVHTAALKHAAIVKEPTTGRRLDVYTTEPAVHFYSGNFLHNVLGKAGVVYQKRAGFCLETQHFPDAPNHPQFPSTVLQANDRFYSKTVFSFSTF